MLHGACAARFVVTVLRTTETGLDTSVQPADSEPVKSGRGHCPTRTSSLRFLSKCNSGVVPSERAAEGVTKLACLVSTFQLTDLRVVCEVCLRASAHHRS